VGVKKYEIDCKCITSLNSTGDQNLSEVRDVFANHLTHKNFIDCLCPDLQFLFEEIAFNFVPPSIDSHTQLKTNPLSQDQKQQSMKVGVLSDQKYYTIFVLINLKDDLLWVHKKRGS
jgi:hypothetical protein